MIKTRTRRHRRLWSKLFIKLLMRRLNALPITRETAAARHQIVRHLEMFGVFMTNTSGTFRWRGQAGTDLGPVTRPGSVRAYSLAMNEAWRALQAAPSYVGVQARMFVAECDALGIASQADE